MLQQALLNFFLAIVVEVEPRPPYALVRLSRTGALESLLSFPGGMAPKSSAHGFVHRRLLAIRAHSTGCNGGMLFAVDQHLHLFRVTPR